MPKNNTPRRLGAAASTSHSVRFKGVALYYLSLLCAPLDVASFEDSVKLEAAVLVDGARCH